jgi:hypothetical protein
MLFYVVEKLSGSKSGGTANTSDEAK